MHTNDTTVVLRPVLQYGSTRSRYAKKEKDDAASSFEEQLKSKEAIIISLRKDTALQKEVITSLDCDLAKQKIDAKQDILALRNKLERMQKLEKYAKNR